jgi:hypothetical protein
MLSKDRGEAERSGAKPITVKNFETANSSAAIIKALIEKRYSKIILFKNRVHFNGKIGRSIATQHGSTNSV